MPFFLKLLTGNALAGLVIFIFAIWKMLSGHPILQHMAMAFYGLYFWWCGILFLKRWKYAREVYLGIYFISAIILLATGENLLALIFTLLMLILPITLYLYKNKSVSDYFTLDLQYLRKQY